ncbi:MAG TPA: glutamate--tRNA ligase, partial [Gemmatimonadota bacterium]|nr:glutamate--tRNA ligase [Gemmatimonadota bacterium]
TAVLAWAFARRHGGAFLLRFEDTDVEREVPGAARRIVEGLDWLGLDRDEGPARGGPFGPYRQSERAERYRSAADRLLEAGAAYPCYCTSAELEARRRAALEQGRPPRYDGRCREMDPARAAALRAEGRTASLRFRTEPGPVVFRDRIRGEVSIDSAAFGDFVLLRPDGRPTYNFAVVVDDVAMEITHVIRGAGHLPNTPRQVLLYRALGADLPEFVHVPLVLGPDGHPLSKRRGARGLLQYRHEVYHPDAVVNYLSLLSWSSPSGDEVLDPERIVAEVDLDRLGASDVTLDPEKLRWLSGEHLRREPASRLAARLGPFAAARGLALSERDLTAGAEVLADRMRTLEEGAALLAELVVVAAPAGEAARALEAPGAAPVLEGARAAWAACPSWGREEVRAALDRAREASEARGAAFYHPVRAALTSALEGPDLADVAYVLGRDRTLRRLARALEGPDGGPTES